MSGPMEKVESPRHSLHEVHQSIDTTRVQPLWRKIFAFFGPAYLISVGYMDPGNWATDLAGGSHFGYTLIWVLLMSNGMALLLQTLSARLGIIRGRDLAQANRETYPPLINFLLYLLAEVAIAACDLAEVLGMAIGLQLLFGLPLAAGVVITILDTFLLFYIQGLGIRKMEAFIISLIAVVGISFLAELVMAKPSLGAIGSGFIPRLPGKNALYIAIGIIGATVMPHNLYLHSALVQTRKIRKDETSLRQALKLNFIDSTIALNLAFLVNAAILILAASVFFLHGHTNIAQIQDAYKLLRPLLGSTLAPVLFAVALIASGQSSTITGTLAGQIVMEGYLKLRISPLLRRLITRLAAIIPTLLVILFAGEQQVGALLVFSQVLLSLQLSFAIIPLIHFVSDRKTMGSFAIGMPLKILSWGVTLILLYLNLSMILGQVQGLFLQPGQLALKMLLLLLGALFVLLLGITFLFPMLRTSGRKPSVRIHPHSEGLGDLRVPEYRCIAMALDFSKQDHRIIAAALAQGNPQTEYILIHVVESVSARILGRQSDDEESRQDQEQLETYVRLLGERNIRARGVLGFRKRSREIVRIVQENKADLLVLGGHGHTGIRDWIYGETVNSVRHFVHIPVLIVHE